VLAPIAVPALLALARRGRRPELAVLAVWSAAFVALALLQWRFVGDAAPALALLLPATVDAGIAHAPRERRRLLATLALGAGIVLALPMLQWYLQRPVAARRRAYKMALTLDAARWLGLHSPPTSGWLEPGPAPEYGVLAPWGAGHVVRYGSERPVVQDNFGDDVGAEGFAAAEAYFAAPTEVAGLDVLDALRVRYVLLGPTGSGHGRGYGPDTLFAQLRGAAADASAGRPAPVHVLARHRVVYQSAPAEPGESEPQWTLFEVLPAAGAARTDR
jgi:asparagine N-glycosylation enzyme membrane subunit Stt3